MFVVSISQLHHPSPIPQQRKLIIYNSICFSISIHILEMVSTELPLHVGHQGHLFVQLRTLCQVSIALCWRNDEAQWRRHATSNDEPGPTNTSAGLRLTFFARILRECCSLWCKAMLSNMSAQLTTAQGYQTTIQQRCNHWPHYSAPFAPRNNPRGTRLPWKHSRKSKSKPGSVRLAVPMKRMVVEYIACESDD